MSIGHCRAGDGDIIGFLIHIHRIRGQNVSLFPAFGGDLIPQLTGGVLIQTGGGPAAAGGSRLQHGRGAIYHTAAGQTHHRSICGDLYSAVSGIGCALRNIAGFGSLRHRTRITLNGILGAILCRQLCGGIVGTLQLGRCLLRNLDLGQGAAVVKGQIRNQNNVACVIGIQRIAQLEVAADVAFGGVAIVGGYKGNGICSLPCCTPAQGHECRAVRAVVCRIPAVVFRHTAVIDTVYIGGCGEECFNGYAVADIRACVDGLCIGQAVGFTLFKGVTIAPAIDGFLRHPCQVVQVIGPIHNILLVGGGHIRRLGRHADGRHKAQHQSQNQHQADKSAGQFFHGSNLQ